MPCLEPLNVLGEQASWMLYYVAKNHWVINVENILNHDLSTWYPLGPLVPKGCPLVHALKWLSPILGVDVQLVPDGSYLWFFSHHLAVYDVVHKLVNLDSMLFI